MQIPNSTRNNSIITLQKNQKISLLNITPGKAKAQKSEIAASKNQNIHKSNINPINSFIFAALQTRAAAVSQEMEESPDSIERHTT